jgi:hypothetical protein
MELSNDFGWIVDTLPITIGVQFYWTLYGEGPTDYDYNCVYTVTQINYETGFVRFDWDVYDYSNDYTVDDLVNYLETGTIKIKWW